MNIYYNEYWEVYYVKIIKFMRKAFVLLVTSIFLFNLSALRSEINYLDPAPNSKFVNIKNNIIIGFDDYIDASGLNNNSIIEISGSKSGMHTGTIMLTKNGKKILYKIDSPFLTDETVSVNIRAGIKTTSGNAVTPFSYSFNTQKAIVQWNSSRSISEEIGNSGIEHSHIPIQSPGTDGEGPPPLTVITSNNPTPGLLFMSSFAFDTSISHNAYMIIAENNGVPYYNLQSNYNTWDFKKQFGENLTYFESTLNKFYMRDINYNMIDSFYAGNGYVTDLHELRLLDNGHALLLSYDPEIVNMSEIVAGGNPAATVVGLIVQEIDENKNVVFQWRSWDHYLITDATHEDLTAWYIDYVHGNAIEIDTDGNIIISCRHMDELTKIDITTGDIIWRMGGRNNEFNFVNDPIGFSHQHAIRHIANGNFTLFDNGNFHTPHFSRALEYNIDQENKIATLVWQYRHTPDIYGLAMGYVQRLNNGNTLICWGLTNPTLTEVTPSGTIALEMSLPNGIYTYRAFRGDWFGEPVSVHHVSGNLPKGYRLGQNYPNPFNPSTVIQFDVPKTSVVEITLFDINGKKIRTLINRQFSAGKYSVSFDGSHLSSGVYFYRLKTADFTQTNKMILLK